MELKYTTVEEFIWILKPSLASEFMTVRKHGQWARIYYDLAGDK